MSRTEDAAELLRRRIAADGPIAVADYMEAANGFYYGSRDPIGAGGDFVTAPEISQMFGELAGLWLAELWHQAGRPEGAAYAELGPGRGTLAADALRAMRAAGLEPEAHLVETSPALRRAQAERVPRAHWHESVGSLPESGPLLIVANEFFDALPVRQFGRDGRELRVRIEGGRFVRDQAEGIFETCPAAAGIVRALARRLKRQGGAALIFDYGHEGGAGDTLQAVSRHDHADPWEAPGTRDLTAYVDFAALAGAAREEGASVRGPADQGAWLEAMGIGVRAGALKQAAPERRAEIEAARERLTAPDQMGRLFQAMAIIAPGWPEPEGFG